MFLFNKNISFCKQKVLFSILTEKNTLLINIYYKHKEKKHKSGGLCYKQPNKIYA